ncbi:M23 family metallopeptidase [Legionella bononiensis]|uniref:M23 family metallopeptidase n=1 Tax=Legionella bononiensis TaxID=2793102 RepID=A0ABS1W979_9GAMM|nr:M23 family metallopeptidase [Legionella bononiensis]MBL7480900.1 M23 family metallopeptidase [Legionella bononiensis]MBL7525918.1 M23 family metallopeptidase [Legionella bononiensis]MBL7564015.1 M23 family metallopeptidase [Legionella bononiensis]
MRFIAGFFTLLFLLIPQSFSAFVKVKSTIKPTSVLGSDDNYHQVYELVMKQKKVKKGHHYALKKIEILNKKTHKLITQYDGEALKPLVYMIKPDGVNINTTELDHDGQMVAFLYTSQANQAEISSKLIHRLSFIDKDYPEHTIEFEDAIVKRSQVPVDVISSPVQGGGWLACNGPGLLSSHRFAYLNVHGSYYLAQRFAIDWVRIDEKGNVFMPGTDRQLNENYLDYGVSIYSATDGTITRVRNEFLDNAPGQIPIEVQNVDNACGNEITVEMSNGHYAHYCHLKPDSMTVKAGDKVYQGQLIAALGNSGNSMGPHLHFHISDNDSPLGSEGLPYIIKKFGLQITPEQVEEVGILDFHASETDLMDINIPGLIKMNAMPMQNGVYHFNN